MPTTHKIIAQSAPAAGVTTDMPAVGTGKQVITSSVTVCNYGALASTIRIAARPSGEALAEKHRIVHDLVVNPGDTLILTPGITLAAGAVLSVQSAAGTVAFSVFGAEVA